MWKCPGGNFRRCKIAGSVIGSELSQRDMLGSGRRLVTKQVLWSNPYGVAALTLTSMQGACHDSYLHLHPAPYQFYSRSLSQLSARWLFKLVSFTLLATLLALNRLLCLSDCSAAYDNSAPSPTCDSYDDHCD